MSETIVSFEPATTYRQLKFTKCRDCRFWEPLPNKPYKGECGFILPVYVREYDRITGQNEGCHLGETK